MSIATVGHAGGSIRIVIIPWGIDSPIRNLCCCLTCILEGVFLEEFTILQGSIYGDADVACLINGFSLLADRSLPFQLLSVDGHKTEAPAVFAGYPFILLAVWRDTQFIFCASLSMASCAMAPVLASVWNVIPWAKLLPRLSAIRHEMAEVLKLKMFVAVRLFI